VGLLGAGLAVGGVPVDGVTLGATVDGDTNTGVVGAAVEGLVVQPATTLRTAPAATSHDVLPPKVTSASIRRTPLLAYLQFMVLSRGWALFLIGVGVWTWAIWPRFAVAIWNDPRSWSPAQPLPTPTSFLWVHALLIVTSLAIGTTVGILGIRAWRAAKPARGDKQHGQG
jgi:hypothetical protein